MFQIAIDTDTMPVSPAVYADEYRGRALPTVLPLVQGFRGNLRVYFLGEHAPSENAAVALYLRALQSKEKLVQTGLGTRGISDAGNVYYDVPLAADTTALSAVLGNRENVIMRAGIVANDVTASPQTNFEWQLNIAVSASAIGTGEKPPVSPNAIEEHNNDVAAHPFILQKIAAAEVDVSGLRASVAGVSESLNATNTNLNNAKSELSTEISEVSAALAAETIARENEDAAIRAALESETNERKDAVSSISENVSAVYSELKATDDAISAALAAETIYRETEDAAIREALKDEITARCVAIKEVRNALVNTATGLQNCIKKEIFIRLQHDEQLNSRIVAEANCRIAEDSEIRAALTEEETARSESVSELRSEVFTEISNVSTALCAETNAREREDASIRTELDLRVKCVLERALHASDEEMACRIAADSEINVKVKNLSTELGAGINAVCSGLSTERTCRKAADNALRGSINTLNSDVSAIEGNIQNLENRVVSTDDALSEHINNTNPHWSFDCKNNVFKKTNGVNKEGIVIASYNSNSDFYRGIYIQPDCGCFSPNGSMIKFDKNGCILISLLSESISLMNKRVSIYSTSGVSIMGRDMVSLSAGGISLSSSSGDISLSSSSGGISLSSSSVGISLSGQIVSLSSSSGGISLFLGSVPLCFSQSNGNVSLIQKGGDCAPGTHNFCILDFSNVAFVSKNQNEEVGTYSFGATCVSLCRSGGNVLHGNSSQTALYFGTTAFATSKIDSGARVVCFGNPLGKVNIKAGNGGRIDICATCVYVNGVKIST